ncbi:hypothetical protein [Alkalihalobacillus deserti]|uniref:hypothetical protein n=1 Tax=Alkalihalobacillus deserti TaxID=2879466 RepID=UPI001D15BC52|nr:hypothetical protein [Alkalihalobacillus deserti]
MKTIWLLLSGIILLSASSTSFFYPTKGSAYVYDHVMVSQDLTTQENLFSKSQNGLIPLMVLGIFLVIHIFFLLRKRLISHQAKHFLLAVFYQSNNFLEAFVFFVKISRTEETICYYYVH